MKLHIRIDAVIDVGNDVSPSDYRNMAASSVATIAATAGMIEGESLTATVTTLDEWNARPKLGRGGGYFASNGATFRTPAQHADFMRDHAASQFGGFDA